MISARFDSSEVDRWIEDMTKRGHDLRPVFRDLGKEMRADIKEHFATNQGPDGPWQQLASSTQEKRVSQVVNKHKALNKNALKQARRAFTTKGKLKGKALNNIYNLLGRLKTAIAFKYTPSYLEARSRVKWAGVHQYGGTAGHGSSIPARPFLYASERLLTLAMNKMIAYVATGNTK